MVAVFLQMLIAPRLAPLRAAMAHTDNVTRVKKKKCWKAVARYGYGLNLKREERGLKMAFSPNWEHRRTAAKAGGACLLHLFPSPLPAVTASLYLLRRNLAGAALITCSQFQPNEGCRIPLN